jgi:hypothetical protein
MLYYSSETLTHYKINLKHTRQGDRRNNDDKGEEGERRNGDEERCRYGEG